MANGRVIRLRSGRNTFHNRDPLELTRELQASNASERRVLSARDLIEPLEATASTVQRPRGPVASDLGRPPPGAAPGGFRNALGLGAGATAPLPAGGTAGQFDQLYAAGGGSVANRKKRAAEIERRRLTAGSAARREDYKAQQLALAGEPARARGEAAARLSAQEAGQAGALSAQEAGQAGALSAQEAGQSQAMATLKGEIAQEQSGLDAEEALVLQERKLTEAREEAVRKRDFELAGEIARDQIAGIRDATVGHLTNNADPDDVAETLDDFVARSDDIMKRVLPEREAPVAGAEGDLAATATGGDVDGDGRISADERLFNQATEALLAEGLAPAKKIQLEAKLKQLKDRILRNTQGTVAG